MTSTTETATAHAELATLDQPPLDAKPVKLDKILDTIQHTRECLKAKIDGVPLGLSLLQDDHKKLVGRVSQAE